MKHYHLFYLLLFLIITDIILTIYGIKCLGALEINPLCKNFDTFMFHKCGISSLGLIGIWYLSDQKYWYVMVSLLIIIYSIVLIMNLWHTVNYLYY